MSEQELKPCPFCGGDAEIERHGTPRQSAIVTCTHCGCTLESNEQGAGHFWNERQACAERKDATIEELNYILQRYRESEAWHLSRFEQQAAEIAALRGFAQSVLLNNEVDKVDIKVFAEHYKLIDETSNPTKLLTG